MTIKNIKIKTLKVLRTSRKKVIKGIKTHELMFVSRSDVSKGPESF